MSSAPAPMDTERRNRVVCFALTPAVQRTLVFENLRLDAVNRARCRHVTAAGKGVNVALALAALGRAPHLLGFAGGDSGAFVRRFADERNVRGDWIESGEPTRTCTTVIDEARGHVTELVEEAPLPGEEAWIQFHEKAEMHAALAGSVALSGALMPGAPEDTYARIVEAAHRHGARCYIDSQGEPLRQLLKQRPYFVKLNAAELAATLTPGECPDESLACGVQTLRALGATWVLVTDGPRIAWLAGPDGAFLFEPPSINPYNPIGSGDCVTAGILDATQRGAPMPDAVAWGIACGSANALTPTPAQFALEDVERLRREVDLRPV